MGRRVGYALVFLGLFLIFFGAVERGDLDEMRRLYHPDARVWHNFDQVSRSVEENLRTLTWMVDRAAAALLSPDDVARGRR